MARRILIMGVWLALLVCSSAHGDQEKGLEALVRSLSSTLSEATGDEVELLGGRRGLFLQARGPHSDGDRELGTSLVNRPVPWGQEDGLLQDYLSEMEKAWDLKVHLSPKVRKVVDGGAIVPGGAWSGETLGDCLSLAGEEIGEELVWTVHGGVLYLRTAAEEESSRRARREKLRKVIREVGGEEATFLGDRYLLLYTKVKPETEEEKRIQSSLATQMVTISFEETPLAMVFDFLQDVTGMDIPLSKRAEEAARDLTVNLQLNNAPLNNVMDLILEVSGEELEWTVKDDAIYVRTREEGKRERPTLPFLLVDIGDILKSPIGIPAPASDPDGRGRER